MVAPFFSLIEAAIDIPLDETGIKQAEPNFKIKEYCFSDITSIILKIFLCIINGIFGLQAQILVTQIHSYLILLLLRT